MGEIVEIDKFLPIPCDKEGDPNPPVMRRSVFLKGKFIEAFDFNSLKDPDNKVHKEFWNKYGKE